MVNTALIRYRTEPVTFLSLKFDGWKYTALALGNEVAMTCLLLNKYP